MTLAPRIALFQPLETAAASINPLFSKPNSYELFDVKSIKQLVNAVTLERAVFDAIVVPSTLFDRSSAVTACIQIKAELALVGIAVVVLSSLKDKAAISTFYGAGADVVLLAPFDAELIHLQISALSRRTRMFQEELDLNLRDKGLRQALITALNFIEDSVVIFDKAPSVVFANLASKNLLEMYDIGDQALEKALFQQLEVIAGNSKALLESNLGENDPSSSNIRLGKFSLTSALGKTFEVDIRAAALRDSDENTIAYCLVMNDLSVPLEISRILLQSERMQSVALLLASAAMKLLDGNSLGSPGKALAHIDDVLSREGNSCSLSVVLTSLLEFLDIVVSSAVVIRVSISEDIQIAVKANHLFQIVGSMILYCLRCSSSQSETYITVTTDPASTFAKLSVRSAVPSDISIVQNKRIISSIRNEIMALARIAKMAEDPRGTLTISKAREIAKFYRLAIEEKMPSETEVELWVHLPICG